MEEKVTYRKVGSYWVAWRGRQAIWEDLSPKKLLDKLKEMGITDAQYAPLVIAICR